MKTTPLLLAGATALLFAACKENAAPKSQASAPEAKRDTTPVVATQPPIAMPDTFKIALGKVYEGYTLIQAALAQDDLPKAKEALSSMHAILHMMPKDGLDATAKAYWDSTEADIMAALHPMSAAESIDSVRIHFMDFSLTLAGVVEKIGLSGDSPVYRFHCPMANDNRGADWLQKDREIQNPYFGKSMLTCGNLVRPLKG